jgi:hypothetical protein
MREQWTIDKAKEEKRARDDVLAQCAKKLTAHYLFFQRRLRGAEDDLEEIARFADECRDLHGTLGRRLQHQLSDR